VTQIYDADCQYLENDSVFAVKDSLTVKYKPTTNKNRADVELEVSGCRSYLEISPGARSADIALLDINAILVLPGMRNHVHMTTVRLCFGSRERIMSEGQTHGG
jgi:hypothetical protein